MSPSRAAIASAVGLAAGALRSPCTRSLQTLVPGPGGERCAYTAPSTAGALFPALSPADLPPSKSYDGQGHSAIRMARHQGSYSSENPPGTATDRQLTASRTPGVHADQKVRQPVPLAVPLPVRCNLVAVAG